MKKIILVLSLFLTGMSYAQSVKVSGILKDSDNLVIETANVMAINQVTKAMDAYNITSEKGEFSLNLKPNTEYIIKAGYIGYAPFEQKITTTKEKKQRINILLVEVDNSSTSVEMSFQQDIIIERMAVYITNRVSRLLWCSK